MLPIAHQLADGRQQQQNQDGKQQRHRPHTDQGSTIYGLRVGMRLVGKAEISGLHAKRQQYQYQRHIGIDICDDAVASAGSRELGRIEWYQQVVQEPPDNAR